MLEDKIQKFLEFRKTFTKREWIELNRLVQHRLEEKAAQLELDDLDVRIIKDQAKRFI